MKRKLPLLAALLLAVGASVVFAFAFTGGARAETSITWGGQGVTNGVLDSELCGSQDDPFGANQPYLQWNLTNAADDLTSAILVINNVDSYPWPGPNTKVDGKTIKWFTPFYDLSTLQAVINYVGTLTGNAQFTISHGCTGLASPTITTVAAHTGSAPNISVSDTATLHDFKAPVGGTMTFSLFGPNDPNCTGTPAFTSTNSPDSTTGVATSDSFTLLLPGTYSWTASYSGDNTNNNPAAEFGCGVDSETYTFSESTSSVITQVQGVDSNGHVALGSSVHDEATVTPSNATGSVTFTLYKGPFTGNDCTTGTIVQVGGKDSETVTPLVAGVADSTPISNLAPGSYAYKADYTSDSPFFSDAKGDCEPFTVDKGQLTADTILHDAKHNEIPINTALDLGSVVHDTAQISGQVDGFDPTGAVTFTFFNTIDCSDAGAIPKGAVVADEGSGDPRSPDTAPLAPGSYGFEATVAGDDNYNGDTSSCEPFTVNKGQLTADTILHDAKHNEIPINTALDLGSVVHDTAQISGQVDGFDPTGAVTFTFFNTIDCSDKGAIAKVTSVDEKTGDPRSPDTDPLAPGSYGFEASVAGDDNYLGDTSSCEPFTVNKGQLTADTKLHDAAHKEIPINTALTLGANVHDTAQVTGQVQGFDPANSVTFTFFKTTDCSDTGTSYANVGADEVSGDPRSVATGALGAGTYGFQAAIAGDDNYLGDTSSCEPFTVKKGDLTLVTYIHDSNHNVVTFVPNQGIVHDTAHLGGATTGFTPDASKVGFVFYNTIDCTGDGTLKANTGADEKTTPDVRTADVGPLSSGAYSFRARFAGDDNYNAIPGSSVACEPLSVRTFGKTMGFWGNNNGQARILANGGYAANSVDIGRGGVIDTQGESLKVLPNTLNACGKGTPIIFTGTGAATSSADCTSATGINKNSLNTLSAQTLALGYNIKLVSGFTGQPLAAFGCTLTGTGLTGTNTVNDAFTAAKNLIDNSRPGGTTTQAQIGAMNTLLGCINAEA